MPESEPGLGLLSNLLALSRRAGEDIETGLRNLPVRRATRDMPGIGSAVDLMLPRNVQDLGMEALFAAVPPARIGKLKRLENIQTGLPKDVVEKFLELADSQRGLPERAMQKLQKSSGGGVLDFVAEHVGDLTHRMTQHIDRTFDIGRFEVLDKATKTLRTLDPPRGMMRFAKEHAGNLLSNARFRNIPLEQHSKSVGKAMKEFADEHRKLVVYNRPQWLAREAAISIGDGNWEKAATSLRQLIDIASDPKTYKEELSKVLRDRGGKIQGFRLGID